MRAKTGQKRTPKKAPKRTWRAAFLLALSKTGNVSDACRASKKSRSWAYEQREADESFKRAWDEAMDQAVDALEAEARRRAVQGVDKPVFYKGKRVRTRVREYSDVLLIFLLKAARPDKYRENYRHEHAGPGGAPITVNVQDMEALRKKRWEAAAPALAAVIIDDPDAGAGQEENGE